MSIQTHKDISPQFISIRPTNLYKEWNLTDSDITTKSTLKSFMSASRAISGDTSELNTYYSNYTGSIPTFPGLNVKYARYYPDETGSIALVNDYITDDDGEHVLSFNYMLGNGDRFYPTYQSQSGWINPDGSYCRAVYYSLKKLFYGEDAIYQDMLRKSSTTLGNEAIVLEIPQRFVADTIEPGTFILTDMHNINLLPYSTSGSSSWGISPYDNTISDNVLALEGIKLMDDSYGNIYDYNYSSSIQRGNIFYEIGLVVITDIAYARYFREYLIISGNII